MDRQAVYATPKARFWAGMMGLLCALFGLRVAGQALQRGLPRAWLPPFAAWQGSSLPYTVLLPAQLAIAAGMAIVAYRAWVMTLRCTEARARASLWIGAAYLLVAVGRVAVGALVPQSPAWFHAWISGAFHIVLACFVLAFARYQSLLLAVSTRNR